MVEVPRKRIYESPLPVKERAVFQLDKAMDKLGLEVPLRDVVEDLDGEVIPKLPTWSAAIPYLFSPPLLPVAKD